MSLGHKNKIALIDGYGFVFRAFHSLPPLTRSDGTPVGAVYGFTTMLIKLLANLQVSHIAVVFDSGSKTFRNDMYPAYKANRPPCPEELIPQFPIVREVAEALHLPILERVGFEADDLIATVAKQAAREDFEVLIVSSDKDLMQLVDGNIKMYDALKNRMIGEAEVEEKFFVKPNQVLDVLSLMGDASDNVPGVRGIGPKTAAELINQYQTLENLFEHLHEIKQEKRRQMLIDGVDKAKLSKQLITLCETVPVSDNMEDYKLQNIDGRKLMNFLEKQGFRALVAKVKKDFKIEDEVKTSSSNIPEFSFDDVLAMVDSKKNNAADDSDKNTFDQVKQIVVSDISQVKNLLKIAIDNGNLLVDFILEKNEPRTVILASAKDQDSLKEVFYINLTDEKNNDSHGDLFAAKSSETEDKNGLKLAELMSELMPVFLDDSVNKIGYKIKELIRYIDSWIATSLAAHASRNDDASGLFTELPTSLRGEAVTIQNFNFNDIELMAYVLNSGENKTTFDVIVADNLSEEVAQDFSQNCQEIEKGKTPEAFSDEARKIYFYCFKSHATWKIYKNLKQRIFNDKLSNVYYAFEKPLVPVLARIENNGIAVDEIKLKELSIYFDEKIKELTKEIHILAGEEVNIGSPKQLAQILFEKLNLASGKKSSKTGALSTNSEVLEELDAEGHIIAGKILEWRQFSKLKSTYSDALFAAINPQTKRIHTTFSNTSTTTGRLSSNNPNLQNIPIRSEEGRKIRSCFIAQKNHKLISADYSQIELRVLAAVAGIDSLAKAFVDDKDIHNITAAQVFGVNESEVDKEMRRKAKAINFGIIYGISAFGLARQLDIDRTSAAKYIENYFATYPGIQKYMQDYKEFAHIHGYVQTIIGRKCFIPTINNKNPMLRALGERLAINAPIQGSAADIIKKAMIDFDLALSEKGLKSKMVLQVHDELLVEAPDNEVEEVSELLRKSMQNAIMFNVPLKIDLKISERWE